MAPESHGEVREAFVAQPELKAVNDECGNSGTSQWLDTWKQVIIAELLSLLERRHERV